MPNAGRKFMVLFCSFIIHSFNKCNACPWEVYSLAGRIVQRQWLKMLVLWEWGQVTGCQRRVRRNKPVWVWGRRDRDSTGLNGEDGLSRMLRIIGSASYCLSDLDSSLTSLLFFFFFHISHCQIEIIIINRAVMRIKKVNICKMLSNKLCT